EAKCFLLPTRFDKRGMQVAPVHDKIAILITFLETGSEVNSGNLLSVDGVDQYKGIWIENMGLETLHDAHAIENGMSIGGNLDSVANFADFWSALKDFHGKSLARQCQGRA